MITRYDLIEMKQLLIAIAFFLSASVLVSAQVSNTSNFRSIVETNLKEKYQLSLDEVCQIDTDSVTMRVFREYGAVFVAKNVMHPYRCIFDSDAEVQLFPLAERLV